MTKVKPIFAMVPITDIDPGPNVRLDETGLDALAVDIRQHGILQPITLVPTEDGKRPECLFGHRRLAAAKLAGLTDVPCILRERGSARNRVLVQLSENRKRQDMSILEEALVLAELRKCGMSQTAIAEATGINQSGVSQRLQLLEYPDVVQRAVHHRLLPLKDALCIPLDIATRTDGRTLAAKLRGGAAGVRAWLRDESYDGSTSLARKQHGVIAIDVHLYDEVKAQARRDKQTIGAWVEDACRAHLEGRGQ